MLYMSVINMREKCFHTKAQSYHKDTKEEFGLDRYIGSSIPSLLFFVPSLPFVSSCEIFF